MNPKLDGVDRSNNPANTPGSNEIALSAKKPGAKVTSDRLGLPLFAPEIAVRPPSPLSVNVALLAAPPGCVSRYRTRSLLLKVLPVVREKLMFPAPSSVTVSDPFPIGPPNPLAPLPG